MAVHDPPSESATAVFRTWRSHDQNVFWRVSGSCGSINHAYYQQRTKNKGIMIAAQHNCPVIFTSGSSYLSTLHHPNLLQNGYTTSVTRLHKMACMGILQLLAVGSAVVAAGDT